jgi:hypothetical protein
MVKLEKTLAEIEVLVGELDSRAKVSARLTDSEQAAFYNFYQSLAGITQDSKLVYKKYFEARKALKQRRKIEASVYLGELALDCKNLADNLNIFMQTTYGKYADNLKSLETNTQTAPKTEDGKTLFNIFAQTHDHSKESLAKKCRDSKGHGRAHLILRDYSAGDSSGYILQFNQPSELGAMNVQAFLDSQANKYLQMTKTILQTIADKDTEHFTDKTSYRKLKTKMQQARNFYHRHSKPFAIALASTLLTAGVVGGSVGTIAYQNYQRQKELERVSDNLDQLLDWRYSLEKSLDYFQEVGARISETELLERRKMQLQREILANPCVAITYNLNNVFGTQSNLFEKAVGDLQENTLRRETVVDNYIFRSVVGSNMNVTAREALDRRAKFRMQLNSLSNFTKGKVPTPADLEILEKLTREAKDLFVMRNDTVVELPRRD